MLQERQWLHKKARIPPLLCMEVCLRWWWWFARVCVRLGMVACGCVSPLSSNCLARFQFAFLPSPVPPLPPSLCQVLLDQESTSETNQQQARKKMKRVEQKGWEWVDWLAGERGRGVNSHAQNR